MKKIAIIIGTILLMVSGSSARIITGSVTDASSGDPLAGVTIQIKGTSRSTFSDADGKFSIEAPGYTAVLVFTSVGFQTLEVEVTGSDPVHVVMEPEIATLEEVVVTGYSTEKKKDLLGSVSNVTFPEETESIYASAPNTSYALAGRAAGVSVRVRGIGSLSKSQYTPPQQEYNTESYADIQENGFKNPFKEPLSTFSIDVDAASYSNVRRFINEGQRPVPDAVRIEEMINYFDYDYPQPTDGHPFSINYELGECPWNSKNLLLHIGLQGEKMHNREVPKTNLVFLLDVSGSMDEPNKLPLVKKAMTLLTNQLREQDRVAIVTYASCTDVVLPSTSGAYKEKILAAINSLQAGGSTTGSSGLQLAYRVAEGNFIEDGNNRIILATDGDFNVGPSSNDEMERLITAYRKKGIFISVAGFGMGNIKDDKMELIADKGNGNYSYIDNLMEAQKVFIKDFSSTIYTIAKDVKIQIEFNPAYVKEYRLVGYENRLLNEEDFSNDKKDAGELGAGHTVTALYEIVPAKGSGDEPRRLKYQESNVPSNARENQELATIKFRYKKPESDVSTLMERIIPDSILPLGQTSDNFRFSAAVAGFGMLLRGSEYVDGFSYSEILGLARASRGRDEDGYRAEFIRLVELSESWR